MRPIATAALLDTVTLGFDTNRTIRESFGEAGYPVPEQRVAVRTGA